MLKVTVDRLIVIIHDSDLEQLEWAESQLKRSSHFMARIDILTR